MDWLAVHRMGIVLSSVAVHRFGACLEAENQSTNAMLYQFHGNRVVDVNSWDLQLFRLISTAAIPATFVVIAVLR
eukprot:SAG22_NODE_5324_length_1036_cov_1.549626_2_plen_75_part_00